MPSQTKRHRMTPFQILVHLFMAPQSRGSFSWQLGNDQMTKVAEDLRWIVLRKIFPELNGCSPYKSLIQKHAVRVDSLDTAFFVEILEVVKDKHHGAFQLSRVREMDDLDVLREFFVPVILDWAESERSTSVSRERTPSIEDLIVHEDSSGNVYQRFPDEFAWVVRRLAPDLDPEEPREIPEEMRQYAQRVAADLAGALGRLIERRKFEKYVLLVSRLEDSTCTWEMTFDYLQAAGMKKYANWKSLSVVANRALREFIAGLPKDTREALHQDDPALSQEEKHARLRDAVSATLDLHTLPTVKEILAGAAA